MRQKRKIVKEELMRLKNRGRRRRLWKGWYRGGEAEVGVRKGEEGVREGKERRSGSKNIEKERGE
jgi:hypothetical protein